MNSVLDEVQQYLQETGLESNRQVAFDWLTNRVPTQPGLFPMVEHRLMALFTRLRGDWSRLSTKRRRYLRFDFQVDEFTLIEVDEQHHFSSARLASLDFYDGLCHGLDLTMYRELCSEDRDSADKYLRGRETVDFPFAGGLTAQRAYFDTCKDLLAAAHGYRLIRIPVPNEEFASFARLRLRVLL